MPKDKKVLAFFQIVPEYFRTLYNLVETQTMHRRQKYVLLYLQILTDPLLVEGPTPVTSALSLLHYQYRLYNCC